MRKALLAYADILKKDGNEAGEKYIKEHEGEHKEFRKWAHAIRQMVRIGKIRGKDGYQSDG